MEFVEFQGSIIFKKNICINFNNDLKNNQTGSDVRLESLIRVKVPIGPQWEHHWYIPYYHVRADFQRYIIK